jgi:hypothetical protein
MVFVRSSQLWLALGVGLAAGACAQGEKSAPPPDQIVKAKPAGACQGSDGVVADNVVVYRCVVPGQGITSCPRYVCKRCNNGTWTGEYSCQLR